MHAVIRDVDTGVSIASLCRGALLRTGLAFIRASLAPSAIELAISAMSRRREFSTPYDFASERRWSTGGICRPSYWRRVGQVRAYTCSRPAVAAIVMPWRSARGGHGA